MDKRVILLIVLASILILASLGGMVYAVYKVSEIMKEIPEPIIQELDETLREGGAEVPIDIEIPKARYLLPIHTEDFVEYTSPYGIRKSPFSGRLVEHQGVDMYGVSIRGTWHARIVSIADGEVVEHWPPPDNFFRGHPVYGGMVRIKHLDGTESLYAHLSKSYVKEGQRISVGTVIGRQGNSGQTRGEHLHFELRIDGILVNPLQYIGEVE